MSRPHLTLEGCAVPGDNVTAAERLYGIRRTSLPAGFWPSAAALFLLVLLAHQDVQHRDEIIELKTQHAAELAGKVAAMVEEIEANKQKAKPMRCIDYGIQGEQWRLAHCVRSRAM